MFYSGVFQRTRVFFSEELRRNVTLEVANIKRESKRKIRGKQFRKAFDKVDKVTDELISSPKRSGDRDDYGKWRNVSANKQVTSLQMQIRGITSQQVGVPPQRQTGVALQMNTQNSPPQFRITDMVQHIKRVEGITVIQDLRVLDNTFTPTIMEKVIDSSVTLNSSEMEGMTASSIPHPTPAVEIGISLPVSRKRGPGDATMNNGTQTFLPEKVELERKDGSKSENQAITSSTHLRNNVSSSDWEFQVKVSHNLTGSDDGTTETQTDYLFKGGNRERNDTLESAIQKMDVDLRTFVFQQNGPGENGAGVVTNVGEQQLVADGWKMASFNQYVSDKISLERSVPDTRHHGCRRKRFDYSKLPKTSVIICFTDESWSTLLRTVHSVFNRSPSNLLEEVILVDDFSQRAHLKKQLDDYLTDYFPKVKLVRLLKRQGLIRARLIGVEAARGPIITFLDSQWNATRYEIFVFKHYSDGGLGG